MQLKEQTRSTPQKWIKKDIAETNDSVTQVLKPFVMSTDNPRIRCYGEISISAGYLGRYPQKLSYNNWKYTTLDYHSRIRYNSIIDSYYGLYVSSIIGQTVGLSIFTHRSTVGRRPWTSISWTLWIHIVDKVLNESSSTVLLYFLCVWE